MGSAARLRLLLDTHTWLWGVLAPERVSAEADAALADPAAALFLSPISVWETLMLARKGRIKLTAPPQEFVLAGLRRSALNTLPVTHAIAMRCEALDGFASNDPADRFLVATALEHDCTLVTADRAMHAFEPLPTLW